MSLPTMTIALVLLLQAPALPAAPAEPLPGVLIERRLAEAASLGVGDTLRARPLAGEAGRAFVVEGVFERAADPARISRNEYEVVFHLPDLEALLGTSDRVDRFAIALAPGASPDSAARWIEALAFGTRAYGTAELADESSATFRVISRFHRAIGVVTILASAIFLLCVMIIRVDERRRDLGLLRLIGISRATVFRAVVLEALGIALLGSVAGAALGVGIAQLVNAYYMSFYDTTLRFALVTPRIVWLAGLLGLVLGAAAGVLAALRVVRLPPRQVGER
jgi:putative ABC transport system permease protein